MLTDQHQQLLTHHALGELPPGRRTEVEALLASDPEARAWVAEVRRTATVLADALAAETAATPGLDPQRHAAIAARAAGRRHHRRWWVLGAGLAAAALAVALIPDRTAEPATQPPQVAATSRPQPAPTPTANPAPTAILLPPAPLEEIATPLLALDLPMSEEEEPPAELAAKGREEAVADAASGDHRAFMAIGSAGGMRARGSAPQPAALGARGAPLPQPRVSGAPADAETYAAIDESGFADPQTAPLSTFGLDVDTASYANVRRFLEQGRLPPRDAVRIEEMLNAFAYGDPPPAAGSDRPFAVHAEIGACPWAPAHRLARIAVRTPDLAASERPACNLVFLVDVSGSMADARKLDLVQYSLRLLASQMRPVDRIAIVTYAGDTRVALPGTPGSETARILAAVDALRAGGSTNGAAGIQLAYATARANAVAGVNRVILCTDGDFNVGAGSPAQLQELISEQRRSGVTLTVLGFGMGNLKDANLQTLADHGDGTYAYIDSEAEARRALVQQLDRNLVMLAKDAKVQVEFNPARVASWRLIGYEKRRLRARDFADDRVDAGDIGAGTHVTALYELEPRPDRAPDDGLRYQAAEASGETLFVQLRWKRPDLDASELLRLPLRDDGGPGGSDLRFAAAVAAFGMVLRDSPARGGASLALAGDLARSAMGADRDGQRAGFLRLVAQAAQLAPGR